MLSAEQNRLLTATGPGTPGGELLRRHWQEMRARTFSGVGASLVVQDAVAVASQGPVRDRTAEHLGYTDNAVTAARHQLLDGIRNVQAGRDPRHVKRTEDANHLSDLVVCRRLVPVSLDCRHV
jgi:hypothetical protein